MRVAICSVLLVAFASMPVFCDEAEFQITFEASWTLQPLPGNAHFSPLIGATHSAADEIFSVGTMVSPGVENVAELGVTNLLQSEINQKIANGTVGELILRPGNVGPANTVTVDFTADSENSLVSMLTMIACLLYTSPSPRDLSTSRMPSSA